MFQMSVSMNPGYTVLEVDPAGCVAQHRSDVLYGVCVNKGHKIHPADALYWTRDRPKGAGIDVPVNLTESGRRKGRVILGDARVEQVETMVNKAERVSAFKLRHDYDAGRGPERGHWVMRVWVRGVAGGPDDNVIGSGEEGVGRSDSAAKNWGCV